MPQISTPEYERVPLRVHNFLAGVQLHDVWAIDLPCTRSGITLDEFSRTASAAIHTLAGRARARKHPSLLWSVSWLGSRAGRNRMGNFRNAPDNRRSLEISCARGHAGRTFPRRVPLRK